MSYLGDFRTGKVVRKCFNTFAIAGESITMATDGTISAYKDGGTTQSTTGITFTENFDGLTGVHLVAVDTSADGTFYSAGSDFEIILSGATVDGKAINASLFSFSLENRSALMPTTAGRTLDVTTGGGAGIDWNNVENPTTTLNLSGTTVKTATDVESDTADIQSRLPAALVGGRMDASVGAMANDVLTASATAANYVTEIEAAVSTVVSGIDSGVADLLTRVPAALTAGGLMKADMLALNGGTQSAADLKDFADDGYDPATNKVQGVVLTDTVTTYTGNTPQTGDSYAIVNSGTHGNAAIKGYVDDIGVAGAGLTAIPWNAAWDAEVQSEVDDAIVAQRLDELLNADSDIDGAAPPAVGSVFHELMTKTTGSFTFDQTTDSLEAIRDASGSGGLDAAGVRAAVGLASANLDTQLAAIDDAVDTEVAAIKAKTDQLTFTTANKVDATIQAAGDFAQAAADKVWSTASRTLTAFSFSVSVGSGGITSSSFAAGAIDAAAIATDAIGASELAADAVTEIQSGLSTLTAAGVRSAVGLASANLDVQLAAIDDFLDTEIAAILSAVDTEVGAIKTVTDQLTAAQAEPSAAPAANATPLQKIAWMAALARNKINQTATTQTLRNDGDSADIATAAVSDNGTTFTRAKWS